MAYDVNVKIDMAKPIGSVGFGVPLILEVNATKAVPYKECKSLADVVSAGFASTTKVYKAAATLFMQDNAPAKIAVCGIADSIGGWLTNVDNVNKDWRQLIVVAESGEVDYEAAIPTMETLTGKMLFVDLDVADSTELTVKDIEKTVLVYAKATDTVPSMAAAVVGATAGKVAGSVNYKNVKLKGVEAQTLTESELDAIHAKGGMTVVLKAGDIVTSMGKTAGGKYIDLVDGIDYVISNIEYKTQKTLNNADKISFNDSDIAILESVCVDVMRDAFNKGIIAADENGNAMYKVNYARRAETEEADRATRAYKGGRFSFTVAGAIDTVDVVGELEI